MTVIETERLVLRPVAERDAPAIVDGCGDPDVARFIPVMPAPYGIGDARGWLADVDRLRREADEVSFAITLRGSDELEGVITIRLGPGGSVGYWLRPRARGRGLMTHALRTVADWAVAEHGRRDLHLKTHPDNVASRRVAEQAGFVYVGDVEHDPAFRDGTSLAARFELRA